MALPTSGYLQASDINVELGRAWNSWFDMNGAAERNLAGKPSGVISFWDFYGKSNSIREPATGEAFEFTVTQWYYNGVSHVIDWARARIYSGPPPGATVTVAGTWTYYRGSYAGDYGAPTHRLYRIGRY